MKARLRLVVLLVAAACAAGAATAHFGRSHTPAVPSATLIAPDPVDSSDVDGGWWDWHKADS
jgi:hypothetical protein